MAVEAKIDGNKINDARPLAVQSQANSGVDIGDVTVNNAVGAAAVNVQDGGNSLTVDGAVTATLAASTASIGKLAANSGVDIGDVDVISQPELAAARDGRAFCQKLNDKTGINAAATVLTDAGLLKATTAGSRDVLTCMYAHLSTNSDTCAFEIVTTAAADGSGTVTVLTPLLRIETGAANDSPTPGVLGFDPPIVITPAMGGAWTIRAQTNDAGASVTFGVNGWREEI